MPPDSEKEVLRQCKAGNARFFEVLVRTYEGSGLRLAMGILGNAEDARDAVQDAFVKAWKGLSRFDLERPFRPWFFQILRNQCRDALRIRKARFKFECLDETLEARPADPEHGPERFRERRAARRALWSGLEKLEESQREIILLKEIEGCRYKEIAEILDVPEGTVGSRLYHARRALARALREAGVVFP